jgi:hypothetical protein
MMRIKQYASQNYFSKSRRACKNCTSYLGAVHARAFKLRVNRCSGVPTEPEMERSRIDASNRQRVKQKLQLEIGN